MLVLLRVLSVVIAYLLLDFLCRFGLPLLNMVPAQMIGVFSVFPLEPSATRLA